MKNQITKKISQRQKEIYTAPLRSEKFQIPTSIQALEKKAKSVMSKNAFAYVEGGAGDHRTIFFNRNDFDGFRIRPKMLRDVSQLDLTTTFLGHKLPAPIIIAPIGVLSLAHPKADIAVCKAASKLNIPVSFSNQASFNMEDCSAVMGSSPRFFQLYWSKSDEMVRSFLRRAEDSGCSALIVTLDTTRLGWRTQDLDLQYLPFLYGKGLAQYISDPVFNQLVDDFEDDEPTDINFKSIWHLFKLSYNYPGGFFNNLLSQRAIHSIKTFIDIYSRPSINWEDLRFLKENTTMPIFLKGILSSDDAQKAIDYGADGIYVSNHGGRQVDGSVSAISCLAAISRTVRGKVPIIFDSGVRTGADVFKAIGLGADVVALGRPYVYGLAIAGELGVSQVLLNLMADLRLTMGLSGCKSIQEIGMENLKTFK